MSRTAHLITGVLTLVLGAGCGLTESEQTGLATQAVTACPEAGELAPAAQAVAAADLIVQASSDQSYFVDPCHRAFVLQVDAVWKGKVPEPILAIVPVDPYGGVETWGDLGRGDLALFLLERDPEIPEAFRPLGEGAGILDPEGPEARSIQSLLDEQVGSGD